MLDWTWMGRVPYARALAQQREARAALIRGDGPEALWLLEHDPVITTGRRTVPDLPTPAELSQVGTDLVRTERGGLATWHGPGQLVVYAIVDAWSRGLGAKGMIAAMESGVMGYLSQLGVHSGRRCGAPGIWVGSDKICAIGMHFSRGVSMHGLALNLSPDMSGFGLIQPCGITDGGVTSVAQLLGSAPSPQDSSSGLAQSLINAIEQGSTN
jgi:lipoyl(octanoyl) transferase